MITSVDANEVQSPYAHVPTEALRVAARLRGFEVNQYARLRSRPDGWGVLGGTKGFVTQLFDTEREALLHGLETMS